MPTLPVYLIDAFTDEAFKGNTAGVCLLAEPLPAARLLQIAQELNQAETAFLLADPACPEAYHIRYFTPTQEIPLCGHATLAAASLVLQRLQPALPEVTFRASPHVLTARRGGPGSALQFPLLRLEPLALPLALLAALGLPAARGTGYAPAIGMGLVEVAGRELVQQLRPDFEQLRRLALPFALNEIVVTSRDAEYDFVSRCFCPWIGVDEDPVTGAAHVLLAAYWGPRLRKQQLTAYQLSRRGGRVELCIQADETVVLTGATVLVVEGFITFPAAVA